MLLLKPGTDKIEVVTDVVNTLDVHASWGDYDGTVVTPDCVNFAITTAVTTVIVAAPATGVKRSVFEMHCRNKGASPVTVTVLLTVGSILAEPAKVTLLAGERLSYAEGYSFRVYDANGLEKVPTTPQVLTKKSLADHAISSTTATEVTDLSLGCGIGTWLFEYYVIFRSATSSVGPKLSVNYDGTVTTFLQTLTYLSGLTVDSTGVIDQDAVVPQVMAGMAKRAKDAAATLIGTAGVDTVNLDTLIRIAGLAVVTVAGNFELWHGSETATSTTVMKDSSLILTKIE